MVGYGRYGPVRRRIDEAATRRETNSVGRPYIMNIHAGAMDDEHDIGRTIIHEGIHFLPQNSVFLETRGFNSDHAQQFNAAAEYFSGLPE